MIDFSVQHLRLAGPAQAVAAGVRQIDAGAQAGVEDGLALGDLNGIAEGFDRQLMCAQRLSACCQFLVPLTPSRPGVQKRISDLWPMPWSPMDFSKSGEASLPSIFQTTLDQSIFSQSGCGP